MTAQQLLNQRGRTLALAAGILAATAGFTILTATTSTAQLRTTEIVRANVRGNYDILVRPPGTQTSLERVKDLIAPNFVDAQYGGITLAQWRTIRGISGVAVAAPIATLGYTSASATVGVDLTGLVDPTLDRQVIRLRTDWVGDGGLTNAREPQASFVYVTRRPVAAPELAPDDSYVAPDGSVIPARTLAARGCTRWQVPYPLLEQQPGGRWQPICGTWFLHPTGTGVAINQSVFAVYQELLDGSFLDFRQVTQNPSDSLGDLTRPAATKSVTFTVSWPMWFPMAAVDPGEEARLIGLDKSVIDGSYLPINAALGPGTTISSVPVIIANHTPVGETLAVTTDRVGGDGVVGTAPAALVRSLTAQPGTGTVDHDYAATDVYARLTAAAQAHTTVRLDVTVQASAPGYTQDVRGVLHPTPVVNGSTVWSTTVSHFGETATGASALEPYLANDSGFRKLGPTAVRQPADINNPPHVAVVGVFDPTVLTGASALAAVPMDTYVAPSPAGADARTRALLHNGVLAPGNNPASYVVSPPTMITTLQVASRLVSRTDLISAIRVRVAGVTGVDDESRERVRLVAEQIAERTGLQVDIAVGSSPAPQTVDLPAGRYGRPDLLLREDWTKKGVAVAIVDAIDRKSLILFGLVLIVCALFVGNAVSAAVRDRTRELAVLACLGWSRPRIVRLIATEVGVTALAAGLLGSAIAWPLGGAFGIHMTWQHALLAPPVALGLAIIASTLPALRAGRVAPVAALHTPVRPVWRVRPKRSIASMSAANLWRTPSRTLIGAISLAVGVAALTLMAALVGAFHGQVVGTLLGDAVALQIRGVDIAAISVTVALGAITLADVLYLNVRERASELATLRAIGWTDAHVSKLITFEALGLGLLGATLGTAAGLGAIASFTDTLSARIGLLAAAVAVIATALTMLVATLPINLVRRLPMADLLAED